MNALIGHTGFVGGVLSKDIPNCDFYNSENIKDIKGKKYTNIFCCGVSGVRWWANQNPNEDWLRIESLINNLKDVQCHKFFLISTIAVEDNEPYGVNRKRVEDLIEELFPSVVIYRLPSVYGDGLKKNLLFDMLNDSLRSPINLEHTMQWYNVNNLYNDILSNTALGVHEFYNEPITHKELTELFDKDFNTISDKTVEGYKTIKPKGGYLYPSHVVKEQLKKYINGSM